MTTDNQMHRRAQKAEGVIEQIEQARNDFFNNVRGASRAAQCSAFSEAVCRILDQHNKEE